jgi:hypothetical protein
MNSKLAAETKKRVGSARPNATPDIVADEPLEDSFTANPSVNVGAVASNTLGGHHDRRRRKPTITDGPFTESKELIGGSTPPNATRR